MKVFYIGLCVCMSVALFTTPPRHPPKHLVNRYTLGGSIPIKPWYFNGTYNPKNCLVYKQSTIDKLVQNAKERKVGSYPNTDPYLYAALDKYSDYIKGKSVAIMGSVFPWYESIILAYGGLPVTIEYNKIISEVPELKVLTVDEFKANPLKFDVVLSISSFEHDGLGRYGDPLNPEGDLEAMQSVKGMLKPGGILILAVPIGKDALYWNAHRVYGKKRLPMLLEGWKVLDSYGYKNKDLYVNCWGWHQPIFILQEQSN